MIDSILLVKDDKTRDNSIRLVHDNLRIVEFASICNLPIHAVVPGWGTIEMLSIGLETILIPWAYVTEKHRSVVVCTFRVVVAFRGMGGKIEAMPKPLKVYILPDMCRIKTRARYPTDTAVSISTRRLRSCDVARKFCSVKVFLDRLVTKALSVGSPFAFLAFVLDCKYSMNDWSYSFLPS